MFNKKTNKEISPRMEVILTESEVIVRGEDFEKKMNEKNFLAYLRGLGEFNNISRKCGIPEHNLVVYHNPDIEKIQTTNYWKLN